MEKEFPVIEREQNAKDEFTIGQKSTLKSFTISVRIFSQNRMVLPL